MNRNSQKRLRVCLVALVMTPALWAQLNPGGTMKDFRMLDYDKVTQQLRSVMTGRSAKSVGNGQVFITQMRLEFYEYANDRRRTNFVVEAPTCLVDSATHVASSPGKLEAWRADGQLAIFGEGFEFRQADGQLTLSNEVRTVFLK